MEKQKQIDEMAKEILKYVLKQDVTIVLNHEFGGRHKQGLATHLYNAGYRKERQREWISVEDRLPQENQRVLVYLKSDAQPFTRFDTDRIHNGSWVRWDRDVTHWMPLPKPPKMKGAE